VPDGGGTARADHQDLQEYESRALQLTGEPERLKGYAYGGRSIVNTHRCSTPCLLQNLEDAYLGMLR